MELIFELVFLLVELLLELIALFFVDTTNRGISKIHGKRDPYLDALRSTVRNEPPPRKPTVDPMLAACGYVALGWLIGMLSLWLVPHGFIKLYWLRVAGLLLVPIASGLVMAWVGSWRKRHDRDVSRIETFAYGFCFAFTMALVRFIWGAAG